MHARIVGVAVAVAVVVNLSPNIGPAQAQSGELSAVARAGGIAWQVAVPAEGGTLRISGPSGIVVDQEFSGGSVPALPAGFLPDGIYHYEIWAFPAVSATTRQAMEAARASGSQDPTAGLGAPGPMILDGSFAVEKGAAILHDETLKPR
jgi:hypothetical protein